MSSDEHIRNVFRTAFDVEHEPPVDVNKLKARLELRRRRLRVGFMGTLMMAGAVALFQLPNEPAAQASEQWHQQFAALYIEQFQFRESLMLGDEQIQAYPEYTYAFFDAIDSME